MKSEYTVRAAHCDHQASEDEILAVLRRITAPLTHSWEILEKARTIVIKPNMMWPPDKMPYFAGRRRELVDDAVLRATLRLLRERTTGRLVATDTTFAEAGHRPGPELNYMPILEEFGVDYVDSNDPPFAIYEVPGGGLMFRRYQLSACFEEADAVVSLAKMKSHVFMGVTLSLKNLFGLPPQEPHGKPRNYFHHIIRLAYVLPDLGMITKPCLNIVDALTGQSVREWGGEGRICNALIAGDHPVSTDACGAWLMGHDPGADWPTPPFKRDRNPLLVAAENGYGTVDLERIDFETEVNPPLAEFDSMDVDTHETITSWRRTTCEQGLFYRDNRSSFEQYAGQYIFLQDGELVWNGLRLADIGSRRDLSGEKKDHALWLKLVDPEDVEEEHFEVYEKILSDLTEPSGKA